MMSYWTFDHKNGLSGVDGTTEVLDDCSGRYVTHPNPTNPAVLPETIIAYALRTSRVARTSFQEAFPNLLPDEQERLTNLLEDNPRMTSLVLDDQRFGDRVQAHGIRSIPVRTVGRRGGKGFRGGS